MQSLDFKKLEQLINKGFELGKDSTFLNFNSSESFSYKEFKLHVDLAKLKIKEFTSKSQPIIIIGDKSLESYVFTFASILSERYFIIIKENSNISKVKNILNSNNPKLITGHRDNLIKLSNELIEHNYKKKLTFVDLSGNIIQKINQNVGIEINDDEDLTDICYVLYTSGTTGLPKGVMISNQNLYSFLIRIKTIFNHVEGYRFSQLYDQSFDLSIFDLFLAFLTKSTLFIPTKSDLILPIDYIQKNKLNFIGCTPSLISLFDNYGLIKNNLFPNIKNTLVCGEVLDTNIARKWLDAAPNSDFYNTYGPTEATIFVSIYKLERNLKYEENLSIPIGKSMEGLEFVLINENNDMITATNNSGHLVISGDQLSNGYKGDREKTILKFRHFPWDNNTNKWYLTGDNVRRDQNGNYIFLGRIDNQVKIRGHRIELEEIELVLKKYCFINDAIVVPYKQKGITVSTICFSTQEIDLKMIKEINKNAIKYIDKIFIPNKYKRLEAMPKTASGKIDRNKIKEFV